MYLKNLSSVFNFLPKKIELTLNDIQIADFASSHFPNYLVFNEAKNIQSTLNSFDIEKCKKQLSIGNLKTHLIKELIHHKDTSEVSNKFFKDGAKENVYRFINIKAASSTVIDDTNYFPLRINQLVVNNLQVGLALSAPKKVTLPSYYQFLFEYRIPAIHIILQKEDFFNENDMPQYHTPIGGKKLTKEIKTQAGDLKISASKGDMYNKGKISKTQIYFLYLEMNATKHCVKILHSSGWKDHYAIQPKHLDELLAIRNHAFNGMQRSNIITHCRAGVGRTGTLLTAEVMSQLHTSLTKTIIDLRDSRNSSMVQTPEQIETLYSWAKQKKYPLLHE